MKLRSHLMAAAVGLVLVAPALAHAEAYTYTAQLSGAAELPEVETPATGQATITLDEEAMTLRVQASFEGLIGKTTSAHIHCCTASPLEGNAGVATAVPSFPGFPSGVSAGTYDQLFDLMDPASWNAAFLNKFKGDTMAAMDALEQGLDNGTAYLNVHSSAFASGEIRGYLTPAVPEPGTFALTAVGLALVAGAVRGRRPR